jgi:plasmid stabilization system protein ParE
MNWRFQPEARKDLRDRANYYDDARTGFGSVFSRRFQEFVERILQFPQLYGQVDRCPRGRDVREGMLEQFETVVTYEVRTGEIVILAVTDGRKNRRPWRSRLTEA